MASQATKNVLVVSYLFPPAGSVGVHRTLRFLKWLPHFGWNPIVLTPANAKVMQIEPHLLECIAAGQQVHRSWSFEALNYGTPIDNGFAGSSRWKSLSNPLRDLWKYCAVPDDKLGWVPFASRAARRIARNQQIDAIYVTGKPFSSYWIGHRVSRSTGIPWVMDLRDLWVLNRRLHNKTRLHGVLNAWMERKFVESAAAVIANTPGNHGEFCQRYPEHADKFVTITNGYDADDFREPAPDKFEKFTIGYVGHFYFQQQANRSVLQRLLGTRQKRPEIFETHSPKFLFEALQRLFSRHPAMRDHTEVVIAGPAARKTEGLIAASGLKGNVRQLGWISHEESMNLIRQSHVAFLLLSRGEESRSWIPSKLYSYLGSGTPILALIPDGDAATIIRNTTSGEVVSEDRVEDISTAIYSMYDRFYVRRESASADWNMIRQFEAQQLTKKLADVLAETVSARTSDTRLRPKTIPTRGASEG